MAKELRSGPAIQHTASGAIDRAKVVAVVGGVAVYADKDTAAHRHNVRGLAMANYGDGELVCIKVAERFTSGGWSWTADQPVYLGASGDLTQTKPTTGFVQQIGTAESATEIYIKLGDPEDANSRHSHIRETFTLSASDISSKFILLGQTPLEAVSVRAYVEGAGFINQASDYEMDGVNAKKLKWSGLGLDGIIASGDVVVVRYYKGVD